MLYHDDLHTRNNRPGPYGLLHARKAEERSGGREGPSHLRIRCPRNSVTKGMNRIVTARRVMMVLRALRAWIVKM